MAPRTGEPSLREGPKSGKTPEGGRRLHPEVVAAQSRDILSVLIIFRFVNALCIRTFFQPDEYFQALEPAWSLAFGESSGAWLTWEWQHQLRSSLHPALFGAVFAGADGFMSLFQVFAPLRALVLAALPKLVQSVFAALSDFYTWKLAGTIYGDESTPRWSALWVAVFNPWLWYCSTRTFSNSLETTLTVIALYYWPWEIVGDSRENREQLFARKTTINRLRLSLLFAAVAVLLRPTNILIWFAILTLALSRLTLDGVSPLRWQSTAILARETVFCGLSALAVSVVSDRLYFGFWTFPPYRWLHFNLSQSLAVFYGEMPWHYYLLQGLPLLTTTFLPFALVGLFKSSSPAPTTCLQSNTRKTLSFTVLATVGALSLVSHKEVRFIYPLLPILHVIAAPVLSLFFTETPEPSTTAADSESSGRRQATAPPPTTTLRHKFFLANILSINLLIDTYLGFFHQPAPVSVVHFLRWEFERLHPDRLDLGPAAVAQNSSIDARSDPLFALFLTPCHSTPWRSHLVYPRLRARALTCEPPLHTAPGSAERAAYLDEADRFYASFPSHSPVPWGVRFLDEEMWPVVAASEEGGDDKKDKAESTRGGEVPQFIVGFEGIESMLTEFLYGETAAGADLGVNLTRRWFAFNGLFNEDPRRRGRLVVWDTGVGGAGT